MGRDSILVTHWGGLWPVRQTATSLRPRNSDTTRIRYYPANATVARKKRVPYDTTTRHPMPNLLPLPPGQRRAVEALISGGVDRTHTLRSFGLRRWPKVPFSPTSTARDRTTFSCTMRFELYGGLSYRPGMNWRWRTPDNTAVPISVGRHDNQSHS